MNLSRFLPLLLPLLLLAPAAEGEDVKALYEAGRKAEEVRDFKTALADYEKVLDLDEDYEDAFERWDACGKLAEWQESLSGEPTAADLVRLGETLLAVHRPEEEREAYEEAIEKDPACSDAHGHLALWNYTNRGGDMDVVVGETLRFLETSPYRDRLERPLADFRVYGELRRIRIRMADAFEQVSRVRKEDPGKAAELLEAAAGREGIPDAYRTALLFLAGRTRIAAKDFAGARSAFTASLGHAACSYTLRAHLALAALDVREKDLASALAHLQSAVAEGSAACSEIARLRDRAFKPLFQAYPEEMEKLADPRAGDAPLRKRIEEACAKAGAEGKRVLLEWYGPYCPYVMAMEERLAHPEVQEVLAEKYVRVRMDQGSMHRGTTLDADYGGVMRSMGVPSFFVLDPDGSVVTAQKDIPLFSVPDRAFDVGKIVAFLEKSAEEE